MLMFVRSECVARSDHNVKCSLRNKVNTPHKALIHSKSEKVDHKCFNLYRSESKCVSLLLAVIRIQDCPSTTLSMEKSQVFRLKQLKR